MTVSAWAAAGILTSCATNPVTGRTQFMLVSEETEIEIDRKNAPYQFSADYGIVQDTALNAYIDRTGRRLAALTHRPRMPYRFQAVNATYVNAYAFPGGSIAVTRGILLSLENEAELAALIGHELGHVNARHTARQMSKSMLTNAVIGGVAMIAGAKNAAYGQVASALGMIGAGALLASYSRDNEREADALGLEYMAKAQYNPEGFEELMDMLRNMSKHEPSAIELMFSTHPMSDERYRTAVETIRKKYKGMSTSPFYKERYMDNTAALRRQKNAIEAIQKGEAEMAAGNLAAAQTQLETALKASPSDYAGLMAMAKCMLLQKKHAEAERFATKAQSAYPQEAQSYHVAGIAKTELKKFQAAYNNFDTYDKKLPGNPNITFLKGYSLEGMHKKKDAAEQYAAYLKTVNSGEQAEYAYRKLVEWGYLKKQ